MEMDETPFQLPPARIRTCGIRLRIARKSWQRPRKPMWRRRPQRRRAVPRFQGGEKKIKITVYNEPTLSGDYDIDPNGVVSLPLAGTVRAVGLTQPQLEQEIGEESFRSEYLRNPKSHGHNIAVQAHLYGRRGRKNRAEYVYKPGLNILTAMALAGGRDVSGESELRANSTFWRRRYEGIPAGRHNDDPAWRP